jgi:tellurite resistance protein TerC
MERLTMMRVLRRVAVLVGGGALLTIGVAMIVLPGPAVVVIPAAIGVLAIEFEWARRWLRSIRAGAARATSALRGRAGRSAAKAE